MRIFDAPSPGREKSGADWPASSMLIACHPFVALPGPMFNSLDESREIALADILLPAAPMAWFITGKPISGNIAFGAQQRQPFAGQVKWGIEIWLAGSAGT